MMRYRTVILVSIFLLTIGGCAWSDQSEHLKIIGDYEVGWNDLESNRSITKLNRACGDGCHDVLVDSYVYSVGQSNHFIFAKQHPNSDTTTTKYFLIDIAQNDKDIKKGIYGPLDKERFEELLRKLDITDTKFDLNFSDRP